MEEEESAAVQAASKVVYIGAKAVRPIVYRKGVEVIGGSARGRRAMIRRFKVVWRGRVAVLMAVARAGEGVVDDEGVEMSGGGIGNEESGIECWRMIEGWSVCVVEGRMLRRDGTRWDRDGTRRMRRHQSRWVDYRL